MSLKAKSSRLHLVSFGIAAVVIVVCAVTVAVASSYRRVHAPRTAVYSGHGYSAVLGEETAADNYALSVMSVHAEDDTAMNGQHLRLTVLMRNVGSAPLQIAPGFQMSVIDTMGTAYPMTARYLPADVVVGGELEPGQQKTYDVDFQMTAGRQLDSFLFQLDAAAKATVVRLR